MDNKHSERRKQRGWSVAEISTRHRRNPDE